MYVVVFWLHGMFFFWAKQARIRKLYTIFYLLFYFFILFFFVLASLSFSISLVLSYTTRIFYFEIELCSTNLVQTFQFFDRINNLRTPCATFIHLDGRFALYSSLFGIQLINYWYPICINLFYFYFSFDFCTNTWTRSSLRLYTTCFLLRNFILFFFCSCSIA